MQVLPGQIEYGFNVISRNSRCYQLQTASKEDVELWKMAFLKSKIDPPKKNKKF
jgi:hypothetical protein